MQGVVESRCVVVSACTRRLDRPPAAAAPSCFTCETWGVCTRVKHFSSTPEPSKPVHTHHLHASQDLFHYPITRQLPPLFCTDLVALAPACQRTRAALARQNVGSSAH